METVKLLVAAGAKLKAIQFPVFVAQMIKNKNSRASALFDYFHALNLFSTDLLLETQENWFPEVDIPGHQQITQAIAESIHRRLKLGRPISSQAEEPTEPSNKSPLPKIRRI